MNHLLVEAGPAGAAQHVAQIAVPVQNREPPPGQGAEFGKASPIALVVILVLGVATFVLFRSMSKRVRRLPASFRPAAAQDGAQDTAPQRGRPTGQAGGDPAEPGRS